MPREKITRGTANVFADLGFTDPENELAKAKLVGAIRQIVQEKALTQTEIGRLIGIDQPSVSRLMRGRITGFSLNRLFIILNLLGRDIEISVRPTTGGEAHGRVNVATG